jgi:hypothetical protein
VFRLFILLNILLLNLFACQGGYATCVAKVNDSKTFLGSVLSIPVKNHQRLIYSKQTPNAKILKHDPFLSLYLVEDRSNFAYPFELNMRLQLGTAAVDNKTAIEGKIKKHQVGLNRLASWSEKVQSLAVITSSCCSLEGIVTPRGIIEKEYIQRFLSSESSEYGDIGIRVKDEKNLVVVSASDPFMRDNMFEKGDCIFSFDGKKVKNASSFMRSILFSKIGSKHKIKIKRNSKLIDINVVVEKRYGGGDISDTFLESKGIYFDESLHIVRLSEYFKAYGLLIGDRLIQVNGITVKNEDELLRYIEDFKDFSSLLFERNMFQFFVNIK